VRTEVLEEAERELDEAIAYYEKIEPGFQFVSISAF